LSGVDAGRCLLLDGEAIDAGRGDRGMRGRFARDHCGVCKGTKEHEGGVHVGPGSMSEAARIADQLRRAFDGEAWHGDSLFEILEGVTAERAAARPIADAHSIWDCAAYRGLG
jgi:hypothetical protein